jgi:hypothetical protein
MKPRPLDLNVLIALIDSGYEFHAAAHEWFKQNRKIGQMRSVSTERFLGVR